MAAQLKHLISGKLIVFFHQSADLYGSDRVVLQLAIGLKTKGARVLVIVPEWGVLTTALQERNIEFHVAPVLKLSRSTLSAKGLVQLIRELRGAFRRYDEIIGERTVDIVHSNTLAVLGGALWSFRRRYAHVWHVHEIIDRPHYVSRAYSFILGALASNIVCVSRATYSWITRLRPSLSGKCTIIYNGISPPPAFDYQQSQSLRGRLSSDKGAIILGLVGRINRLKGHAVLLDAVDLLHSQGVANLCLVFVGEAPKGQTHFKSKLEQRIARSPMRDRILTYPHATDIWPFMYAMDIICVPSTEPEAFGLVAVEAMAAGRPVIATQIGGLAEVIAHDSTGLLVPPGDSHQLASAIKSLAADCDKRSQFSNAGRAKFEVEFAADIMVDQFAAYYVRTLGSS